MGMAAQRASLTLALTSPQGALLACDLGRAKCDHLWSRCPDAPSPSAPAAVSGAGIAGLLVRRLALEPRSGAGVSVDGAHAERGRGVPLAGVDGDAERVGAYLDDGWGRLPDDRAATAS